MSLAAQSQTATSSGGGTHSSNNNNSNSNAGAEPEKVQMKRTLGLWNGITIIIGVIVGSGIFISPKGVLVHSGSVGASLVVWCLCGLLALLGALCFAELGTAVSSSGGEYTYIRMAYGPLPSFLYIWVIFLVIMPCSNAISALTFANYCLQPLFESDYRPPEHAIRLLALAILMILIYINCTTVTGSIRLQGSFTLAKVFALTLIIVYGCYYLLVGNPFKSITGTRIGSPPAPPASPVATFDVNQQQQQAQSNNNQQAASAYDSWWSSAWAGTQTNLPHLARAFYSGFFTYSGW